MPIKILNKNHIVVDNYNTSLLFSYGTLVAGFYQGYFVTPKWDLSITTTRYVGRFFGLTTKEIKEKIVFGDIIKRIESDFSIIVERSDNQDSQ